MKTYTPFQQPLPKSRSCMNRIQYQNLEKDIGTIHRAYSDYTSCIATCMPMCNSRQFYHMCSFVPTLPPAKYSTEPSPQGLLFYGCMLLSPSLTPDSHSPVLHLCNYVISLMLSKWNLAVCKQWDSGNWPFSLLEFHPGGCLYQQFIPFYC